MVNWGAAETFRVSEQQPCLLALPQVPCCQKSKKKKKLDEAPVWYEGSELKKIKNRTVMENKLW